MERLVLRHRITWFCYHDLRMAMDRAWFNDRVGKDELVFIALYFFSWYWVFLILATFLSNGFWGASLNSLHIDDDCPQENFQRAGKGYDSEREVLEVMSRKDLEHMFSGKLAHNTGAGPNKMKEIFRKDRDCLFDALCMVTHSVLALNNTPNFTGRKKHCLAALNISSCNQNCT